MTPKEQMNQEGQALLRIAREMRQFLEPISHEPEAMSLLSDIGIVERMGSWLAGVSPIDANSLSTLKPTALDDEVIWSGATPPVGFRWSSK